MAYTSPIPFTVINSSLVAVFKLILPVGLVFVAYVVDFVLLAAFVVDVFLEDAALADVFGIADAERTADVAEVVVDDADDVGFAAASVVVVEGAVSGTYRTSVVCTRSISKKSAQNAPAVKKTTAVATTISKSWNVSLLLNFTPSPYS